MYHCFKQYICPLVNYKSYRMLLILGFVSCLWQFLNFYLGYSLKCDYWHIGWYGVSFSIYDMKILMCTLISYALQNN